MAEVPYKASPNVEPSSDIPFRPFEPKVGAETFGGLIAKGIGEFGQQATQTGELWGQLQVDAQSNKTTEALDKAVADLKTHRGQDALTYGQDFDNRVEQIISQGGEGLSAYQLKLYENQVRRYAHISRGEATTWLQSQGAAVAKDTNVGKYNAATTLAARDPNGVLDFQPNPDLHADDPNNVPLAIKMGREAAARQLHWEGMDQNPDAFRIAMQNADAGVYKTSIETMYARDHDPEAAARAVEKLGPDKLGPANYATLSKDFESLSEAAQGRDWAARKSFEPVPYLPPPGTTATAPPAPAAQSATAVGAQTRTKKAGQSYYDWLNENPVAKPRAETPQINMFANEAPGIANAPGQQAISAALTSGPDTRTDIQIESGGRPQYGGKYAGLGQFSADEQRHFHITDPNNWQQVDRAFKLEANENRPALATALGHQPSAFDYYLAHQQGLAGAVNHITHPDQPAWVSMHETAEGRARGAGWARRAIWGNMTPEMKRQFPGGVDTVTSGDFVRLWTQRHDQIARRFAAEE